MFGCDGFHLEPLWVRRKNGFVRYFGEYGEPWTLELVQSAASYVLGIATE